MDGRPIVERTNAGKPLEILVNLMVEESMKNLKEAHSKMVAKAKAQSGVEGLMKVYERFQEANAVTERYLQIISPKNRQSNSNASLLTKP